MSKYHAISTLKYKACIYMGSSLDFLQRNFKLQIQKL